MHVIALGRGKGKTEELLGWLKGAPDGEVRVLVSHTLEESRRVMRLAMRRDDTYQSWQFVCWSEIGAGAWSAVTALGQQIVLGVDNVELVLEQMFHWPVGAISVTPPHRHVYRWNDFQTRRHMPPGPDAVCVECRQQVGTPE